MNRPFRSIGSTAAAGDRRRWVRQNQGHRDPCRPASPEWRRSDAHPAADVLSEGFTGDGQPRPDSYQVAPEGRRLSVPLGRHLPFGRGEAATPVRTPDWDIAIFYVSRPPGCRGPQSIYSFRAAEVRNVLDFPKLFAPEARVITLEQNYRSTQPILKACNKVIGLAKERFTKNLFSERRSAQKPFMTTVRDGTAQARHVADRILKAHEAGVPLKSQAVLFRASHHSGQLEIELAKRNIPFVKWGGIKFLDAAHIKDALSVLRWCQNPRDRIAAFRTLQLLPGIGPQTASLIFEKIALRTFGNDLKSITPPKAALRDWPEFSKLMDRTWREREAWPTEFQSLCKWIGPQVRRKYDDNIEGRLNDLDQLAQIASTFPSREAFLTELAIDPPEVAGGQLPGDDNDGDHLILSTIHSTKGQEWKHVHILNVIDGCIPHARAGNNRDDLEEERRLLYVAMTRAKDELDLVVPRFHFSIRETLGGDMKHLTKRSRFIPKRFQKHFECRVGQVGCNDFHRKGS